MVAGALLSTLDGKGMKALLFSVKRPYTLLSRKQNGGATVSSRNLSGRVNKKLKI